jgi:hypothetical protein
MPCPPELIKRVDAIVDKFLMDRKDEIKSHYENTDPKEFGESPAARQLPIAEPPDPLMDSAPSRIHGAGRRDLFR